MRGLTLDIARQIISGVLAGERSSSDRHIAVALCDPGVHFREFRKHLSGT